MACQPTTKSEKSWEESLPETMQELHVTGTCSADLEWHTEREMSTKLTYMLGF